MFCQLRMISFNHRLKDKSRPLLYETRFKPQLQHVVFFEYDI